jgi:hypothetical protein
MKSGNVGAIYTEKKGSAKNKADNRIYNFMINVIERE